MIWRVVVSAFMIMLLFILEAHLFACLVIGIATPTNAFSWSSDDTMFLDLAPGRRYMTALRYSVSMLLKGVAPFDSVQFETRNIHNQILMVGMIIVSCLQLCIAISTFVRLLDTNAFATRSLALERLMKKHGIAKPVTSAVKEHMSGVCLSAWPAVRASAFSNMLIQTHKLYAHLESKFWCSKHPPEL